MEVISPIESVSLFGVKSDSILSLCTKNCGVLFFNITREMNEGNTTIELQFTNLIYQIRNNYKWAFISPDRARIACLTGIHNQVYIYDFVDRSQDYISISTYPDCCDTIVWSNNNSTLLCYQKSNPSSLYFVHPSTKSSQRISLNDANGDEIMVGLFEQVCSNRQQQKQLETGRLCPLEA